MGVKFDKMGLLFGSIAFQIYTLTFAMVSYRATGNPGTGQSADDAVQAFLILAYLFFLGGFVLLMLQNFSKLDGKIFVIITLITFIVAGMM